MLFSSDWGVSYGIIKTTFCSCPSCSWKVSPYKCCPKPILFTIHYHGDCVSDAAQDTKKKDILLPKELIFLKDCHRETGLIDKSRDKRNTGPEPAVESISMDNCFLAESHCKNIYMYVPRIQGCSDSEF